jgi:hypothetical protein
VTGDKVARFLAGLAVLAVALVAGWVSFGHIATLAAAHGYSTATAHMLPVSVDGLILASSMALLTGSAPWLSRAGLVLGIVATLAANVAAGVQFGAVGALVSVWPAVAFVVASEILLRMIRAAGDVPGAVRATASVAVLIPAPAGGELDTVAALPEAVPVNVPEIAPVDIPVSTVLPTPPEALRTVPARAPRRAPARPKSPARMFAAEVESGELPSLREVKRRAGCGTDRAREILAELQQALAVQAEKAA